MLILKNSHLYHSRQGIKFLDYLTSLGKNEKEFRDGFGENAVNNIKTGLVLGQISKEEKVEVRDKDIEDIMKHDEIIIEPITEFTQKLLYLIYIDNESVGWHKD